MAARTFPGGAHCQPEADAPLALHDLWRFPHALKLHAAGALHGFRVVGVAVAARLLVPVVWVSPARVASAGFVDLPAQGRFLIELRPGKELGQRDATRTAVGHAGNEQRVGSQPFGTIGFAAVTLSRNKAIFRVSRSPSLQAGPARRSAHHCSSWSPSSTQD